MMGPVWARVCYHRFSGTGGKRRGKSVRTRGRPAGFSGGEDRRGFSLVELLVCLAIISVLMALYLPTLSKARRKAEEVVVQEGFRQEYISEMAKTANVAHPRPAPETELRARCREAFRREMTTVDGEVVVTQMLFAVSDEAEFRAYWHTLINPSASGPIEYNRGRVVVTDEWGNSFPLASMDSERPLLGRPIPEAWEFLSTDLSETSSGTVGTSVVYTDSHVDYLPYPGPYPACRTVAELSHRFVVESD